MTMAPWLSNGIGRNDAQPLRGSAMVWWLDSLGHDILVNASILVMAHICCDNTYGTRGSMCMMLESVGMTSAAVTDSIFGLYIPRAINIWPISTRPYTYPDMCVMVTHARHV